MKTLKKIAILSSLIMIGNVNADEKSGIDKMLDPFSFSIHGNAAVGNTSANPETLAAGHHDPTREDGTVQGIEGTVSARFNKLEGFANFNASYGAERKWEYGWEEAFVKVKEIIPDLEIRGGRMLTRFGSKNSVHLHSYDEIDLPVVMGQFLGDDGLKMNGGDLTWYLPTKRMRSGFTFGYGKQMIEAHAHGAHEEDHHEEEEGHEADEHHEEEGHSEDFGQLRSRFFSAKWFGDYNFDDFKSIRFGSSLAVGENHFDKNTWIGALDIAYLWRENGLEVGGKAFRISSELFLRNIETTGTYEGNDISGDLNQLGGYVSSVYSVNNHLDLGTRLGFMESLSELEVEERTRISPVITVYPLENRNLSFKIQYNHDEIGNRTEHGFWLQAGFSFGGNEVR